MDTPGVGNAVGRSGLDHSPNRPKESLSSGRSGIRLAERGNLLQVSKEF